MFDYRAHYESQPSVSVDFLIAQNNRAKLHHTLQYSSDNKAAMNTGGL